MLPESKQYFLKKKNTHTTTTTSTECIYCFNNPRLQKNSSLNHSSSANCRQDPANGFKQKRSYANQASLKEAAIRDVLNEPPDTNRSRDNKEEDGECDPGSPSEAIQMTSTWIAKTPRKRRDERSEEKMTNFCE